MLYGSLDGRGVWGKRDACICMAESFHCSPETITTWLTSYISIQKKKFRKRKKKVCKEATKETDMGKDHGVIILTCKKFTFSSGKRGRKSSGKIEFSFINAHIESGLSFPNYKK